MNGQDARDGVCALDPVRRAAFARELMRALTAHCPGSRVELRGSLARGTADPYSDIDLAWTVPGDRFDDCLAAVREVLEAVRPLDSLRTDPESRDSRERRLVFAAFRGLPLFWRVDLEIVASPAADGRGHVAAHGDDWSPYASALANAVAATKAVLRGQPENARGLLERGFRRIDAPDRLSGQWSADIRRLAGTAADREPGLRPLADRVLRLAESHRAQLLWCALPAGVPERVDELVLAGRDIQAVHAMRESGIEPRPGLHVCVDLLDWRHRALADRMPPPPCHDVDTLAATAGALPRGPVAVEVVLDGDTRGWIVVLTAGPARPWEGVALAHFRIGAAGSGEAARTGRELAERLGVPFRFASPGEPDEDAPRWWDGRD
ncbi:MULTISPECIES: nucleotidyltransferase domain-containing protein [unclassified Streptomyces]|uniref:nucleotidyltransferase domain-containing protein n=1 Tax=unclassified Streptomyces TaxID=2593676 RepID=UPI0037FF9A13